MNYVQIIRNVLQNGVPKQATRYDANGNVIPVENGTIGTFCEIFEHDMSKGFPLTTIRKMPWRSIRVELEGFIKGITDKKWYQDRKCGFWDEWANPLVVEQRLTVEANKVVKMMDPPIPLNKEEKELFKKDTRKVFQKIETDLGPIYGYQWRKFGKQYGDIPTHEWQGADVVSYEECDGLIEGHDQFKTIVDKLRTSPYDRRMVCSAWNPNQMHMMALPPCHWAFNVVVYGDTLNLIWHQRSCDLLLGVGSNIASYALLMMLLCESSGLKPGKLVGTLADCHIYTNHMEAAKILADREEVELPTLAIKYKQPENYTLPYTFDIFEWEWNEAVLSNYNPQEAVEVGAVTI